MLGCVRRDGRLNVGSNRILATMPPPNRLRTEALELPGPQETSRTIPNAYRVFDNACAGVLSSVIELKPPNVAHSVANSLCTGGRVAALFGSVNRSRRAGTRDTPARPDQFPAIAPRAHRSKAVAQPAPRFPAPAPRHRGRSVAGSDPPVREFRCAIHVRETHQAAQAR